MTAYDVDPVDLTQLADQLNHPLSAPARSRQGRSNLRKAARLLLGLESLGSAAEHGMDVSAGVTELMNDTRAFLSDMGVGRDD